MQVPTIDISGFSSGREADRRWVVDQWRDALDVIGFAQITGHGIPESAISGLYSAARAFFDQPAESKLKWGAGDDDIRRSRYVPVYGQSVGVTAGVSAPKDISETLTFATPANPTGDGDFDLWPDTSVDFRKLVHEYSCHAYELGLQRLMRISALALDLPEGYFEPYFSPMLHRLLLAHYPELTEAPEPGQFRNGAHTDFTGFTILRQDDAPGGLQVLHDDEWIDVPSQTGALVINTGDLIQRWTNDRWISNVHRVANPPIRAGRTTRRLSLVFFTGPNKDAVISCLPTCQGNGDLARYTPVVAGEYLNLKLAQTYSAN